MIEKLKAIKEMCLKAGNCDNCELLPKRVCEGLEDAFMIQTDELIPAHWDIEAISKILEEVEK